MLSRRAGIQAAVCAALVLVSACGDDDEPDPPGTTAATATATATEAAEPALDQDSLLTVRDALVQCLREADMGLLVHFRDGEAVASKSGRQPNFESSLAAPEETTKAIKEGALFVGLRDDERVKGLTPDWDVLIFKSQDAATEAIPPLRIEAGDPAATVQSGRFVSVALPDADAHGDDPEGAEAKLTACQETAEGA